MKKLGSLFLTLLLCFSIVGCSSDGGKSTADITKSFKDIGYELKSVRNDEVDAVTLTKKESSGESSQILAYFEDNKLHAISYIYLPEDSTDYGNMIIGSFYVPSDSDEKVDEKVTKAVNKILDKVDLTSDEFVEYVKDIYKTDK